MKFSLKIGLLSLFFFFFLARLYCDENENQGIIEAYWSTLKGNRIEKQEKEKKEKKKEKNKRKKKKKNKKTKTKIFSLIEKNHKNI